MTSPADFPAPRGLPVPPPFGWVVNPSRLTLNETREIREQCGLDPFLLSETSGSDVIRVGAHIALAYARRLDPGTYPWSLADDIPVADFTKSFPGDDAEQENLARAAERAIEEGEQAPDPS